MLRGRQGTTLFVVGWLAIAVAVTLALWAVSELVPMLLRR